MLCVSFTVDSKWNILTWLQSPTETAVWPSLANEIPHHCIAPKNARFYRKIIQKDPKHSNFSQTPTKKIELLKFLKTCKAIIPQIKEHHPHHPPPPAPPTPMHPTCHGSPPRRRSAHRRWACARRFRRWPPPPVAKRLPRRRARAKRPGCGLGKKTMGKKGIVIT